MSAASGHQPFLQTMEEESNERAGNKRVKLDDSSNASLEEEEEEDGSGGASLENETEKEDIISDLPDSLIQHILSFLPETKEAIRTGTLSKRWRNQWTRVPVLIFNESDHFNNYIKDFGNVVNHYDCSKIRKFHFRACSEEVQGDPHLNDKIGFAVTRDVEELILVFDFCLESVRLPEFLFSHASLVKLQTGNCILPSNGKVNWGCLKELNVEYCHFPDRAIENILSGSPLLESLNIIGCQFDYHVIASKSLKKLAVTNPDHYDYIDDDVESIAVLEISCPMLKDLELSDFIVRVVNSPSLISATLDSVDPSHIKEMLLQLEHVKKLKFQRRLVWTLSKLGDVEEGAIQSTLLLNNKCLTLDAPASEHDFEYGIASALCIFYALEKLVINIPVRKVKYKTIYPCGFKNYWSINTTGFDCLEMDLKIVQIIGLSEEDYREDVINFVEYLLKNAKVLEKLTVTLKDGGNDFKSEVSGILSSFPRCSRHAMVELVC